MRALISLLICGLLSLSVLAQPVPKFITSVEGITEYELANGLRVLLMPDAAQTNVMVNIVYKVGSRHEGYGEKGMAHLLEHMLFKQCKKFTDIKKAISDKGAMANGTTWYDRTNYYEILSGTDENLRWALDMEADRMINSKILPEELKKEFSVVRNEFESGENSPSGVLSERIISAMYLWHNYGKSTIGSKEDIERVSAASLKTFYKKYYQPDNAVLIIAGKFDNKKALSYVQQYFNPIPRPARVLQPTYTVEPVQDGERSVMLRRAGDMQYLGLAFHTPSVADKDHAANDAIVEVLTNNPSGYFYKKLVDAKLASKISGYAFTLHDPSLTYYQVDVPLDKNIDSAKLALLTAADEIANLKISEEDLNRAKNSLLKMLDDANNNTLTLANYLTESIGSGDWRLWFLHRERVEKLTVADLQQTAKRYYKKSNRTYGVFVPDSAPQRTTVDQTPDIAALLKDYKGKEVVLQKANFENSIENIKKSIEYNTLPNGGKYALLEKPAKGDIVTGSIVLRYGNKDNLAGKNPSGSLLAGMLKTGTTNRTKEQISDELDKLKTTIGFSDYAGNLNITISTDKKNLNAALNLLTDLLKNPNFDKVEFDKLMIERKGDYESNKQDPQTVSMDRLGKLTTNYAEGHPLYNANTDEKLQALSSITLDDLKKYYEDFYGANNSLSVFVGGIDKSQVTSFLKNAFGSWNSKLPFAEVVPEYFEVKAATEALNTPDKSNAFVMGMVNLQISQKDPDYPAVMMANELLGGGTFTGSRIPQRLREKEGISYGAGSYADIKYQTKQGNWVVGGIFNPIYKNRMDSALQEEIAKAIDKGFTQDELTKSIGSQMEFRKTLLGLDNSLAAQVLDYMRDGRDLSDFTDFENKTKALNLAAVNAAMKKYFDRSRLVMVYAGDFDKK